MAMQFALDGSSAYSPQARTIDGSGDSPAAIGYDFGVPPTSPDAINSEDDSEPSPDPMATLEIAGFDTRVRDTGQQSLFPTTDLVIPDTLRTMRKAVAAIHATPIKAEHAQSLNSRRLFDACIILAQIDFRKRGSEALERVKTERLSPVFETRITDLARIAGIPGKNYTRIYSELDKLFEMILRWNIIGEGKDVEWEMKSHFLSSLGYGKGHKRGLIRFAFDPQVLEIILEPSNWAPLSIQAQEGLPTAPSYALYQNCWRYVTTQQKVTAALPTATWIELLMGRCGYLEDDPEEGLRVVRYADFKRRVLLDAIRRVNDSPALNYTLELKELKSGTRVSKLQFKFIPKATPSLGVPLTWPRDILMVLDNIGFSAKEIEDLAQARSYEEVAESIVRMKDAEARLKQQGKRISSRKAYFSGILENIASGAQAEELDDERLEQEATAKEAQRTAQMRQERLKEAFEQHSSARFAEAVFGLAQSDRAALLSQFEAANDGAAARALYAKGWSPQNRPALALLRRWLLDKQPETFRRLMPFPQDVEFEAWMAWRIESANDSAP